MLGDELDALVHICMIEKIEKTTTNQNYPGSMTTAYSPCRTPLNIDSSLGTLDLDKLYRSTSPCYPPPDSSYTDQYLKK